MWTPALPKPMPAYTLAKCMADLASISSALKTALWEWWKWEEEEGEKGRERGGREGQKEEGGERGKVLLNVSHQCDVVRAVQQVGKQHYSEVGTNLVTPNRAGCMPITNTMDLICMQIKSSLTESSRILFHKHPMHQYTVEADTTRSWVREIVWQGKGFEFFLSMQNASTAWHSTICRVCPR